MTVEKNCYKFFFLSLFFTENQLQSKNEDDITENLSLANSSHNVQSEDNHSVVEHGADIVATSLSFEHSIGVCLYGEKQFAEVLFTPDTIFLSDLCLSKVYQRTILVTNKSSVLPITVYYNKVASIDVYPATFNIANEGSLEVLVRIKTSRLGLVVKNIEFHLLSKNYPEDSKLNFVGMCGVRLEFHTNVISKKPTKICKVSYDLALK